MTALEALSREFDAVQRREHARLQETWDLRAEVARLERHVESQNRLIAGLRDLVELLGGEQHVA